MAYPPVEKHGVVGNRRIAGLVAADGRVSWWYLPNYDGAPVFGALIDDLRPEPRSGFRCPPLPITSDRQGP